jgi:sulfotransferase family protein
MRAAHLQFVLAGAQKSGTTTLFALLKKHRQLDLARGKEAHFFDDESVDWDTPDYARLEALFDQPDGRLRGDATPVTAYWRPAVRRLARYNPDVKIIQILRDPVTRAFAQWRKTWAEGRETLLFSEAIRAYPERVRALAEVEGLERHFSYVERGFYGEQLAYLTQHFPRENLHCEIFEEFLADRDAALSRIAGFLGIGPFPAGIPEIRRHAARETDYPSTLRQDDIVHLAAIFREDTARLEAFLGRRIEGWHSAKG